MREVTQDIKIGIDGEEFVTVQEARNMGFEVNETESGNTYAIKQVSVEVPENIDEAVDEFGAEQVYSWIVSTTSNATKRETDRQYRAFQSMLKHEVPAAVKNALEGFKTALEAQGLNPELIDEIPYSELTSLDKAKSAFREILQNELA